MVTKNQLRSSLGVDQYFIFYILYTQKHRSNFLLSICLMSHSFLPPYLYFFPQNFLNFFCHQFTMEQWDQNVHAKKMKACRNTSRFTWSHNSLNECQESLLHFAPVFKTTIHLHNATTTKLEDQRWQSTRKVFKPSPTEQSSCMSPSHFSWPCTE